MLRDWLDTGLLVGGLGTTSVVFLLFPWRIKISSTWHWSFLTLLFLFSPPSHRGVSEQLCRCLTAGQVNSKPVLKITTSRTQKYRSNGVIYKLWEQSPWWRVFPSSSLAFCRKFHLWKNSLVWGLVRKHNKVNTFLNSFFSCSTLSSASESSGSQDL